MAQSILTSVKKVLGLIEADTSFDVDITMHINSALATLNQIGVGPAEGFMIEDAGDTWDAFLGSDNRLNSVKSCIYLKVRLLFDAPGTSYALASMEKQISEFEWRLNVQREEDSWQDPTVISL